MRLRLAAVAALLVVALAGCGDSPTQVEVEAATPEDEAIAEAIQEELALYSEPFDISALPPEQQDQLAPVYDALPRAAGIVDELTVTDGIVEARTGLDPEPESDVTAQLVCGAIVRGAGRGNEQGHRVLAVDEIVLRECERDDARYP